MYNYLLQRHTAIYAVQLETQWLHAYYVLKKCHTFSDNDMIDLGAAILEWVNNVDNLDVLNWTHSDFYFESLLDIIGKEENDLYINMDLKNWKQYSNRFLHDLDFQQWIMCLDVLKKLTKKQPIYSIYVESLYLELLKNANNYKTLVNVNFF